MALEYSAAADSVEILIDTPKTEEDTADTYPAMGSPWSPKPHSSVEVHVGVAGADLKATTTTTPVDGAESDQKQDKGMEMGLAGRETNQMSTVIRAPNKIMTHSHTHCLEDPSVAPLTPPPPSALRMSCTLSLQTTQPSYSFH